MNNEELLKLYLEKLRVLAQEILDRKKSLTVIESLKEAIIIVECEMSGY